MFNLVDELEAYVLIKKGIVKKVDGSVPELPHNYLLSILCEERKMPPSCKAKKNCYEMQSLFRLYILFLGLGRRGSSEDVGRRL